MAHDNIVIEKKSLLHRLKSKTYYAVTAGLIVSIIHFIVTSIMYPFFENNITKSLVFWILITASMAFTFSSVLLNVDWSPLENFSLFQPLYILFSSSVYGIIGCLLASTRKSWQLTGIVIVGLLILSSCLMAGMWASSW